MTFKSILSAHNQELKHIARLIKQARYRQKQQLAVLEGVHLIETFSQAGYKLHKLYLPHERILLPEITALTKAIAADQVVLVAESLLAKISDLADSTEPIAVVTVPTVNLPCKNQDVVMLERVQDPGNVGTILRSALAAGISHVILSKDCCDVWSPKVLRAAMGAHAYLHVHTVTQLAHWLADYPHQIYATALSTNSHNLYSLDLRSPTGWLFGNEGSGLSAELLQSVSQHVMIPMSGQTESLNVAMAATVCLFEQYRQRNAADK
jgi:RNA methyltransferase, TrmH family